MGKILFILILFGCGFSRASTDCQTYLDLESLHACPRPNYFSDFGFKYCQIFENRHSQFSAKGQATLPVIRSCLISQLNNVTALNCSTAKKLALQHHFDCYLQSGFCELSILDQFKVYRVVRKELRDPEFHATMKKIATACRD